MKVISASKPHKHEFLGEDGPCLICGKTVLDLLRESKQKVRSRP